MAAEKTTSVVDEPHMLTNFDPLDVERKTAPDSNDLERDVESASAHLKRGFHAQHLQFVAIGGTIGTGLFIGSGAALAEAGPVGTLLAFVFIGTIVYSVMVSLCEMATFIPVPGSFTIYASRFVDPSLGFAMGWLYWFSWAMTYGLELTAAGIIIQYWNQSINIGIFIGVFWIVFTAANYMPLRWFGEFEMWFSMIKVVTIVGFIIFAICIDAGASHQGYLGFKYWVNPGPFAEDVVSGGAGKFVGFWAVLVTAGFSYQGAELVGVGAGETADPHKSVPKAVRFTFWGIASMFCFTIFFVGLLVPSDNKDLGTSSYSATASPLVIAANLAHVKVLPDIINAVLLTAVLSAANSTVYSSSRILVALSSEGHAPRFLAKTNRLGTPYIAVACSAVFGLLGFLNMSSSGATVFTWFMDITAIAGFICWALISISHLRFMNALKFNGESRDVLPFKAPFQPYLTWYGLFFFVLITITNGFTVFIDWNTSSFFADYISLILFVVLFVGHKIGMRTKPVPIAEVDLHRGRVESTNHSVATQ